MNDNRTKIVSVVVRPSINEMVGEWTRWHRTAVVTSIRLGNTFRTIKRREDGKWTKYDMVQIVRINGNDYLKNVPNNIEVDNLGDLPEIEPSTYSIDVKGVHVKNHI